MTRLLARVFADGPQEVIPVHRVVAGMQPTTLLDLRDEVRVQLRIVGRLDVHGHVDVVPSEPQRNLSGTEA